MKIHRAFVTVGTRSLVFVARTIFLFLRKTNPTIFKTYIGTVLADSLFITSKKMLKIHIGQVIYNIGTYYTLYILVHPLPPPALLSLGLESRDFFIWESVVLQSV
jgi:hypothetical protein